MDGKTYFDVEGKPEMQKRSLSKGNAVKLESSPRCGTGTLDVQRYRWTWEENSISGNILVGWKRSPRHGDADRANLRDGTGTLDVERERSL